MGSRKVPRMVVVHCNGRKYGNTYIITFKVGPLRIDTLAPSILPLLVAMAEGLLESLEFGHCIRFDVLHGCKTCPLPRPNISREHPKATRSEIRRVRWLGDDRNCCTTSDVWLGALSWCRNHCPCLPLVAPLPQNYIAHSLQNLHIEMTSNTLSTRYKLMVHQTADVKEFQKLLTAPRTINKTL
jgi:hypothetical protein